MVFSCLDFCCLDGYVNGALRGESMTKEQREEMEGLARKAADFYANDFVLHIYQEIFTAGVESERKRAQVLVEALRRYETAAFEVKGEMFAVGRVAQEALAQYLKGE